MTVAVRNSLPDAISKIRIEDPVAEAKSLLPLLQRNAADSERGRRLSKETGEALREKGLFQLMVPRRVGGYEASFRTYVEVCAELCRGDSAAGWVVMILGGNGLLMGLFPDEVRDEVYGHNPLAAVCGQWAPTAKCTSVDGGYRVSGKWMWASGCYESQWSAVGFPAIDRDGQEKGVRLGLVPTDQLTIEDTWFVAGMSGTGSNTFVAQDVFIPERRTLLLDDVVAGVTQSEHRDEALYRSSLATATPLGICGAILGMAEAAWDMTMASLAKGKGITGSIYKDARRSPSCQLNLADARSALDSARLHLLRAADDVDDAARTGVRLADLSRARIRLDQSTALKRCREAVDLLLNIGGASCFASANPLQRVWRDVEVASRHAYVNGDLGREIYGRALLGLEQVSPTF